MFDVLGWRWSARSVEVVGDLLETRAGEVAIEDLRDQGSLAGLDLEDGLVVAYAGASGVGVRDVIES